VALALLAGLCWAAGGLAQEKDGKSKAKPNIIEIDVSKLPPELAKQLLDSVKKKEDVKPISLVEAITIAEKAGKGQATRAEVKGQGAEAQFRVDLVTKDGTRTRMTLSAAGKVVESGEGPPAKEGKGQTPGNERKGPPPGKGPPFERGKTPEKAPSPDPSK
jgi:uncharacterized membrane protein YkoI